MSLTFPQQERLRHAEARENARPCQALKAELAGMSDDALMGLWRIILDCSLISPNLPVTRELETEIILLMKNMDTAQGQAFTEQLTGKHPRCSCPFEAGHRVETEQFCPIHGQDIR